MIAADHVGLARQYPTDLRLGRVRDLDPVVPVAQRRRAIGPNANLVVEDRRSRRPRDHNSGARVARDDISRSRRGPPDGIEWRSDDRYPCPVGFGLGPCRGDTEIIARDDVTAVGRIHDDAGPGKIDDRQAADRARPRRENQPAGVTACWQVGTVDDHHRR